MDTEPATETVTVDRSMELRRRVEATRQAALDAKQNYEQALQTWDRARQDLDHHLYTLHS